MKEAPEAEVTSPKPIVAVILVPIVATSSETVPLTAPDPY